MKVIVKDPAHDVPFANANVEQKEKTPEKSEETVPDVPTPSVNESGESPPPPNIPNSKPLADIGVDTPLSDPQVPPPVRETEILSSMAVDAASGVINAAKETFLTTNPETVMGAHATHTSLSLEDMEYQRMHSTFTDMNGDYALESSLSQFMEASTALDVSRLATVSLLTTVSAEDQIAPEPRFEVVDGTKIPVYDPLPPPDVPIINENPIPDTMSSDTIKPTLSHSEPSHSVNVPGQESELNKTEPPVVDNTPRTATPSVEEIQIASDIKADEPAIQKQVEETATADGMNQPISNSASPGEVRVEDLPKQPVADPDKASQNKETENETVEKTEELLKPEEEEEEEEEGGTRRRRRRRG